MRCYLGGESVRITGKAWEIRHYLKQAASNAPSGITVTQWLDSRFGNASTVNTGTVLPLIARQRFE